MRFVLENLSQFGNSDPQTIQSTSQAPNQFGRVYPRARRVMDRTPYGGGLKGLMGFLPGESINTEELGLVNRLAGACELDSVSGKGGGPTLHKVTIDVKVVGVHTHRIDGTDHCFAQRASPLFPMTGDERLGAGGKEG
jgi:hypothetical protein